MFMIFGVAEDHDSNPIKIGLSRLKERGSKIIAINEVPKNLILKLLFPFGHRYGKRFRSGLKVFIKKIYYNL